MNILIGNEYRYRLWRCLW